jgi:dienelactone hydrolase
MASKLGVVLVHGAWHSPAHFENVTSKLRAEGYAVEVPALPSVAEVAAEDVLAKDVATIKRAI